MRATRVLRHLFTSPWAARRAFPASTLGRVEAAVAAGERTHSGQVCVAIECALGLPALLAGRSARERAHEVFSMLRVWDTERDNGVLIYVLWADRDVEIVADRGIHRHVGDRGWSEVCSAIEREFRAGRFEDGLVSGVEAVGARLAAHCPPDPGAAPGRDALSDRPVML